jgi:menaquinone-dependent protoporphyrinogen oxidase
MKVLVAAASETGATREIARALGEALIGRGIDATVVGAESAQASEEYDALVVGSAVHGGHWLDAASTFLGRSRKTLARRPVWLFSRQPAEPPCSDAEPGEDPRELAELMALSGAREHHVFAGELGTATVPGREPGAASDLAGEIRVWAAEIGGVLTAGS